MVSEGVVFLVASVLVFAGQERPLRLGMLNFRGFFLILKRGITKEIIYKLVFCPKPVNTHKSKRP